MARAEGGWTDNWRRHPNESFEDTPVSPFPQILGEPAPEIHPSRDLGKWAKPADMELDLGLKWEQL